MRIYKEETAVGVLLTLTFMAGDEETPEQFRGNVKSWIQDNYPAVTWEQVFSKLLTLTPIHIELSMT